MAEQSRPGFDPEVPYPLQNEGFVFREGTMDREIWANVFEQNEYRLPPRLDGAIVLDLGAQTGAFAALCRERGAAEVWAVEMGRNNVSLLLHNFHAAHGRGLLQAFHAVCYRSDTRGQRMCFGGHDGINTGGAWAIPLVADREEVPTICFDDIVKLATDFGRRRINLAKFDMEGSEFPALFTSELLPLIDQICGEYHLGYLDQFPGPPWPTSADVGLAALDELLTREGFATSFGPPGPYRYNRFWAWRPCVLPFEVVG